MIYIFGWITSYFLLFLGEATKSRRICAAASILALGAVVVLRGRVGTDTGFVYESMAINIGNGMVTEPFFSGLLFLMVFLFPTPLLAVTMGIGSLFVLSLLIYTYRADTRELFILQAYFIPAAFWGSSISGQRYGLAFTFLLIAMQSIRLRQYKWAVALASVAILTHYSCVLFLALWGIMVIKANRKHVLLFMGALGLLSLILATFAAAHFAEKFFVYFEDDYTKPSILSGLTSVMTAVMLLIAVALGSLGRATKVRFVAVISLGMIASFLVSQYSYGGLRLLGMVVSVVPYAALTLYQQNNYRFRIKFKSAVLAVGLLSAILTYRNMLNEDRVVDTPGRSLPYRFFWQEQ